MSELQVFGNPEFGQVRSMMIDDAPWFVGRDVAKAMGYAKPENAIAAHVEAEDITSTLIQGSGSNYKSQTSIINESGLYSLILSSKLPSAKRFKRWVTSEVLPALRKTGKYEAERATPAKETPPERRLTHDDYLRAASIIATCRNERLPYVLAYLKQGGIDVPDLPKVEKKAQELTPTPTRRTSQYATKEEQLEIIRLINEARNLGFREPMIAKAVGASRNDVTRWRTGMVTPRRGRVPFIISTLTAMINGQAVIQEE